jgi:hypothetical protein
MLWIVAALVCVLAYGVRVNRLGYLQVLRDFAQAIRLMILVPFHSIRFVVRLIAGEVRSW